MTDTPSDDSGRDASGRFAPGNPGRPVGSRNRASHSAVMAILEDFERNRAGVLDCMRYMHTTSYFNTVARLAPTVLERCREDEPERWPGDEPERGARLDVGAAQIMERIRSILSLAGDPHVRVAALQALVFELDPT
jgi:hypothetical protein